MSLEKEIRRIVGYMLRSQGSGEVTAADFASVQSVVAANSAKVTSASNAALAASALAFTANSVANATSVVAGAVASNHASLVSDVGRISLNLSAVSTRLDTAGNNASNAQSIANVVSAAHASLLSDVSRISLNLSAVSTRMDSISNVASNAQSIANAVSTAHASLVSDIGRISLNLSAVSTRMDTTSNALSIETSARNALSVIVSNLNSAHNTLSLNHVSLVSNFSALSAGLGTVQMKVVAGTQTLSAATKISGLSISVAAAGVYQLDGLIIHAMSVVSSFGFGISTSAATFTNAAYRWMGNLSVLSTGTGVSGITNTFTGIGYGNESAIGAFTYSALAGTATTNMQTELKGIVTISTTGGSLQLKAKGGSGNDLLIKQGSYIRAYKIG